MKPSGTAKQYREAVKTGDGMLFLARVSALIYTDVRGYTNMQLQGYLNPFDFEY